MRTTTWWRIVAVALLVGCWLSSGREPFEDAARGMRAPADFARDYVAARARLEFGRGAPPAGEDGNALAARWGAPQVPLLGAPYFIHPPTTTLATLPLAALPWPVAAGLWAVAAAFALVWLAASLLAIANVDHPGARRLLVAIALLALWPPTLYCLEKGQWSLWLAALMAAGFRALEAGRARRAGVLFGLAAALKVTPVVMLGLFVWRERRAAAAMAATMACAVAGAALVVGPAALRAFVAGSSENARVWAPWLANTASLAGVYARFTTSTPYTQPLLDAPALGRAAFALTVLALLAAAAWTTARAARDDRSARDRRTAAWMALAVITNPLGWSHALLMLLPPAAVLWRDARTRWLVVTVLVVFTFPRQSLTAWAGPTPVAPGPGLWLGAHAVAALALFAALCAPARPPLAGSHA